MKFKIGEYYELRKTPLKNADNVEIGDIIQIDDVVESDDDANDGAIAYCWKIGVYARKKCHFHRSKDDIRKHFKKIDKGKIEGKLDWIMRLKTI